MDSGKICIVNVVNNFELYKKVLSLSTGTADYPAVVYDNTQENIGIPQRYNSFINDRVNPDSDFWIIFAHQDFGFFADPYEILKNTDKNYIYGVIAPNNNFDAVRYCKTFLTSKMDYYPSLHISLKNLIKAKKGKFIEIRKKPKNCRKLTSGLIGEINQGDNNFEFCKSGMRLSHPVTVKTIDCCCIIIHSSLINKYKMKFDEKLKWHLYAEELCINYKKNYNIKTKVIQFDCFHTSNGKLDNLPEDFYQSADYVKNKHSIKLINSTCID